MRELKVGDIVKSKAGHDKNRYYVIVTLDGEFVTIADGKERALEKPKRKNVKHLSVTKKTVCLEEVSSNKALRKILEPMNQDLKNNEPRCNKVGGNELVQD